MSAGRRLANRAAPAPTIPASTIGSTPEQWHKTRLIAAYEWLMRQVRRAADVGKSRRTSAWDGAGREPQLHAWRWAQTNLVNDLANQDG